MERVINKVSFIYCSCGSPAGPTQFIKKSTFSWTFFALPNELDYQQVKLQPKRLPGERGSIWTSGEQVLVVGEEMLPCDPQRDWRRSTFRRFGKGSILPAADRDSQKRGSKQSRAQRRPRLQTRQLHQCGFWSWKWINKSSITCYFFFSFKTVAMNICQCIWRSISRNEISGSKDNCKI